MRGERVKRTDAYAYFTRQHERAPSNFVVTLGPVMVEPRATVRLFWKATRLLRMQQLIIPEPFQPHFNVVNVLVGRVSQVSTFKDYDALPRSAAYFGNEQRVFFGRSGLGTDTIPYEADVAVEVTNVTEEAHSVACELHGVTIYALDEPEPLPTEAHSKTFYVIVNREQPHIGNVVIEAEFIDPTVPAVPVDRVVLDSWAGRLRHVAGTIALGSARPDTFSATVLNGVIAELDAVRAMDGRSRRNK
jgi:hypothetical protein